MHSTQFVNILKCMYDFINIIDWLLSSIILSIFLIKDKPFLIILSHTHTESIQCPHCLRSASSPPDLREHRCTLFKWVNSIQFVFVTNQWWIIYHMGKSASKQTNQKFSWVGLKSQIFTLGCFNWFGTEARFWHTRSFAEIEKYLIQRDDLPAQLELQIRQWSGCNIHLPSPPSVSEHTLSGKRTPHRKVSSHLAWSSTTTELHTALHSMRVI